MKYLTPIDSMFQEFYRYFLKALSDGVKIPHHVIGPGIGKDARPLNGPPAVSPSGGPAAQGDEAEKKFSVPYPAWKDFDEWKSAAEPPAGRDSAGDKN